MAIHVNDLPQWAQAQIARKIVEEAKRRGERGKAAAESTPAPSPPPAGELPFRYTIRGDPRTKKNHSRIAGKGKRCPVCRKPETQWIQQGEAHETYKKLALPQLIPVPERPIEHPVHVVCTFYMKTTRRVDGLNLLATVDDLLVEAGILADDNSRIVVSHDGSRVKYDKANPRTEIEIVSARGEENE